GRDSRVGAEVDDERPVGGEGPVPAGLDLLGLLHPYAVQADAPGDVGVGEVGDVLGLLELRGAGHGAHLPGDLVEVAVVQHGDDEPRVGPLAVVLRGRDQLHHAVHLHGAVSDEGDGGPVGVGELRADGVRHAGAHGGQGAGQGAAHAPAQPQVAGVPVGGRAGVGGEDGVVGQLAVQGVHDVLRVDGVGADGGAALHDLPPAGDVLLGLLPPRPVLLAVQLGQQAAQGLAGVADEVDLVRVAQADHVRVDVDLHRAGLVQFRHELGVREAGADHQQGVALL